jgi:hypothetical protein
MFSEFLHSTRINNTREKEIKIQNRRDYIVMTEHSTHFFSNAYRPMTEGGVEFNNGANLKKK